MDDLIPSPATYVPGRMQMMDTVLRRGQRGVVQRPDYANRIGPAGVGKPSIGGVRTRLCYGYLLGWAFAVPPLHKPHTSQMQRWHATGGVPLRWNEND